jgi:hypothetical protein
VWKAKYEKMEASLKSELQEAKEMLNEKKAGINMIQKNCYFIE